MSYRLDHVDPSGVARGTLSLGIVASGIILLIGLANSASPPPPRHYVPPPAQYRCFPEDVREGVEIGMCPDARNQRVLGV